jgi:hypothetical protein
MAGEAACSPPICLNIPRQTASPFFLALPAPPLSRHLHLTFRRSSYDSTMTRFEVEYAAASEATD